MACLWLGSWNTMDWNYFWRITIVSKAGVFYNFKNGLSFITSKTSSKNLGNENCCFLVFNTKREVRNQFSGNLSVFVFIIEIFWQYKWRFIFDGVKNSSWSNSIYFLNSNNMFLWIVFIHFVKIWWYLRNKFNPKCEKQASNVFNFSHDWAPLFFKI